MPTNAKTKAAALDARKTRNAKLNSEPAEAKQKAMSAINLLEEDHREVEEYFEQFKELDDNAKKLQLAQKICMALTVHTQIEEEIFYPAARKATKDNDLLDEAKVEHAGAKNLIAEIQKMKPGDDLFDAKMTVLGEQISHHVEEEETELFPECEEAKMDLEALGAQMATRKAELMKQPA